MLASPSDTTRCFIGCNAWNHYPGCNCGWGGDTGASYPSVPHVYLGELAGDPLTVPTACWWCGAKVFFHRAFSGGCVLFDELGPPWPVHGCWETHRSDRFMMEVRVRSELRAVGWAGDASRPHLLYPVHTGTAGQVEHFSGYVLCSYPVDDRVLGTSAPGALVAAQAMLADVVDASRRKVRVLLPSTAVLDSVHSFDLIEVHGRWSSIRGKLVLAASELSVVRDGKVVIRLGFEDGATACGHCGVPLMANSDWSVLDNYAAECGVCRGMRGEMSPQAFLDHCRKVASAMR